MNKERQNPPPMFGVVANTLARACRAFDNRINCFEMAWVGRKPEFNFSAGTKFSYRAIAKMVLHIAIPRD